MNKLIAMAVLTIVLLAQSVMADQFDTIKKRLAEVDCYFVRFVSVLSSSVFDTSDSSNGFATIARDGRYHIVLGSDVYSFDGKTTHAYSYATNQLIIENLDSGGIANKEISFLLRIDEYYVTQRRSNDREYKLVRKKGAAPANIPDSMTVILDSNRGGIMRIEYLDINDEPVTIDLLTQQFDVGCADSNFAPSYPDSAETIKL